MLRTTTRASEGVLIWGITRPLGVKEDVSCWGFGEGGMGWVGLLMDDLSLLSTSIQGPFDQIRMCHSDPHEGGDSH
jgi:hypothetical protein